MIYHHPIGSIYHLYTTYILPIGWLYISPTTYKGEPETTIESDDFGPPTLRVFFVAIIRSRSCGRPCARWVWKTAACAEPWWSVPWILGMGGAWRLAWDPGGRFGCRWFSKGKGTLTYRCGILISSWKNSLLRGREKDSWEFNGSISMIVETLGALKATSYIQLRLKLLSSLQLLTFPDIFGGSLW